MAGKRMRLGERKPRCRSPRRIEELGLRMRLDGISPGLASRVRFFETIARKKAKNKRTLVEQALLHRAAKRCFRSMVDRVGFLDRKTKHRIREMVRQLYMDGKISFKGETAIDFTRMKDGLGMLIGKTKASCFMQQFAKYLQDEKNYFDSFMKSRKKLMEGEW